MYNASTLRALGIGESARVLEISGAGDSRRLADIGLVPGTEVRCLLRAPCGEPTAYCIRGAVMALRDEDAERVAVEP